MRKHISKELYGAREMYIKYVEIPYTDDWFSECDEIICIWGW